MPLRMGTGMRPVAVRMANLSSVTGVLRGAPRSFQSGMSSSRAVGSRHAPERV